MKLYYMNIEKFKRRYDEKFLMQYANTEFKTKKRFFEYTIGRHLVFTIAKREYGLDNPEILIDQNGKPFFKDTPVYFSISHSKNIVGACFDKYPCGFDVEYIKKRDLREYSKFFEQKFATQKDFYEFWTLKEAELKLNETVNYKIFGRFENDYFFTAVSSEKRENQDKFQIINCL